MLPGTAPGAWGAWAALAPLAEPAGPMTAAEVLGALPWRGWGTLPAGRVSAVTVVALHGAGLVLAQRTPSGWQARLTGEGRRRRAAGRAVVPASHGPAAGPLVVPPSHGPAAEQ